MAAGEDMPVFHGSCHCGALEFELVTAKAVDDLPLRACQCSFCRRHQTRATADPEGLVAFAVRDPAALQRYEFGLKTAAYLLCRNCGCYVGAVAPGPEKERALVNVNCFAGQAPFAARTPTPVSYDRETADERRTRRQTTWTLVKWR
jgi:hypothetical protein